MRTFFFCFLLTCFVYQSNAKDTPVTKKTKNIIIMIGDGMGIAQTYASYTANNSFLNMFLFPFTGISLTSSSDNYITDSAAGGTAMSCGKKTNNGALGKDSIGRNLKNIFEIAKENKLSTGFVVTCAVTHATPAAIYAHNTDRNQYDSLAVDFLSGSVDLAIGGGKKYFADRKDNRNLINELKAKGYKFSENIDSINCSTDCQVICLPVAKDMPKMSAGRGDYLPNAVSKAIEILS